MPVTAEVACTNIKALTAKSQALQAPAQSITIVNGPLMVIGQGPFPLIIGGLTDIVGTATTHIQQLQNTSPFKEDEQSAIADAVREYVRVSQVVYNILVGKAGLFTTVPFIGQPIAAALRQVEAVTDTLLFSLLAVTPNQATNITGDKESLAQTLQTAISSFESIGA